MYREHASTKRIVLTLSAWAVGLLVVGGLIVAASTALAPETPPDKAPAAESTASVAVTPSVAATLVAPPVEAPLTPTQTAPVPAPVPTPAPSAAPSAAPAKSLSGKVVAIDAGHQQRGDSSLEPIGPGSSSKKAKVAGGASGVRTRNPESLINLQVALRLQKELVARGAKVVMVRKSQNVNISNSKRADIANDAKADLFVRLHCDGNSNRSLTGLSTLVPKSNKWTAPIVTESKKAGVLVHKAVISETRAKDRGVVARSDLSGFNWAKVPTVLVEMGFLSNVSDDVKLEGGAYQQALAVGLAKGIEDYLAK